MKIKLSLKQELNSADWEGFKDRQIKGTYSRPHPEPSRGSPFVSLYRFPTGFGTRFGSTLAFKIARILGPSSWPAEWIVNRPAVRYLRHSIE